MIRKNGFRLFSHDLKEVFENSLYTTDSLGITECETIDTYSPSTVQTRNYSCDPFGVLSLLLVLFAHLCVIEEIGSLFNEAIGKINGNKSSKTQILFLHGVRNINANLWEELYFLDWKRFEHQDAILFEEGKNSLKI